MKKLTKGDYAKRWDELMKWKKIIGKDINGKSNLYPLEIEEIRYLKDVWHFKEETKQ